MKYGYARVSTASQTHNFSFEAQIQALVGAGVTKQNIVCETVSGTLKVRPKLEALINRLQCGDFLIVARLDRFARNTVSALSQIEYLHSKKVNFIALDIGDGTASPEIQRMTLSIFLALASFETEVRRSRQRAGIELAKLDPTKYVGKRSILTPIFLAKIKELHQKGLNATLISNALKISRPTVYKALKLLRKDAT